MGKFIEIGLGVTETEIEFLNEIRNAITNSSKLNKLQVEKLAAKFNIFNKNYVKELTELVIVQIAREIAHSKNLSFREKYDKIVDVYYNQVNLSHRTSRSMMLQQYSTPAPIALLASNYIFKGGPGLYFEPSAGNGLLTIAIPYNQVEVNEVDDIRLSNLKSQPFREITNKDASKSFHKPNTYDGIVTNPPFGTLDEPQLFGKWKIKTLDHAMALHALNTMKDAGKASIIIGGHTKWDEQGRIQAGKNRIFFNYLYSHYNVEDVILIDGHKLYSRQGTAFDTRLILIDGRKPKAEGVAPLKTMVGSTVVKSFDELYDRIVGRNVSEIDKAEYNEFKNKYSLISYPNKKGIQEFQLSISNKNGYQTYFASENAKTPQEAMRDIFLQYISERENKSFMKNELQLKLKLQKQKLKLVKV